jgi:hypothetical protein
MILKIRSWDYDIHGSIVPSWVHLNNISIIDVLPETWENFINNSKNGTYNCVWLRSKETRTKPYVFLASITLQNGDGRTYVFEEAYLLNEQGQTIEKYQIR